jgi:hypothetical protein
VGHLIVQVSLGYLEPLRPHLTRMPMDGAF